MRTKGTPKTGGNKNFEKGNHYQFKKGNPGGPPQSSEKQKIVWALKKVIQDLGTEASRTVKARMLRGIRDPDPRVALAFIEVLLRYNLGKPSDTPFDPNERRVAFFLLTGTPGPGGRDPLRELASDPPPAPRLSIGAGVVSTTPVEPDIETLEPLR